MVSSPSSARPRWPSPLRRSLPRVGKRARRRNRGGEPAERGAASSSAYPVGDGVLTLRDELSPGTLREMERLDAKPAANSEDRWQRRSELLFERLTVRWEIAGLPLHGQKELLGRYRMASPEERSAVRAAVAEHLSARHPELGV